MKYINKDILMNDFEEGSYVTYDEDIFYELYYKLRRLSCYDLKLNDSYKDSKSFTYYHKMKIEISIYYDYEDINDYSENAYNQIHCIII